ncbi:hypothetical protein [Nocardioides humi]|nr:hypothetical protein [Nocardioides humi]
MMVAATAAALLVRALWPLLAGPAPEALESAPDLPDEARDLEGLSPQPE